MDVAIRSVGVVSSLGGLREKQICVDHVSVHVSVEAVHTALIRERGIGVLSFTHHLTCYMLPVTEMGSNIFIHRSTINSAQGDFHVHNRDSESGMHNFRSVQISILIGDPMKDFVT